MNAIHKLLRISQRNLYGPRSQFAVLLSSDFNTLAVLAAGRWTVRQQRRDNESGSAHEARQQSPGHSRPHFRQMT